MIKDGMIAMILIAAVMALGLFAGGAQFATSLFHINSDNWSPRAYTAEDGDCFVPPQGDPLYDEHYAEVNQQNCKALKDQAQAKNIDAQTRNIDAETRKVNTAVNTGIAAVSTVGLVVLGLIAFVIWIIRR